MIAELFLFITVFALCVIFLAVKKRPRNFPPGPIGLPLIGHLPFLGLSPHKTLMRWKKSYGPIIGVWFGSLRTVVINDPKLIKEALSLSALAGRPNISMFSARSDGVLKGIAAAEGHHWVEQRRFILRNLRDFGFGKNTMEAKIAVEIEELTARLKSTSGKPISSKNLFTAAVLNALWSILFGERRSQDDAEMLEAFNRLSEYINGMNAVAGLSMFMPWMNKVAPKLSGLEKMLQEWTPLKNFITKQIHNHQEHYVEGQPRDFVDAYADEVKATKDPQSSFYGKHNSMLYSLFDLFGGGVETTSTGLTWMCAYLISYPEVQKKLQDEIDYVIGRERSPCLADRPTMPYTEATISEVMRISTLLPLGVFHNALEDVEFHGFHIPKGTMIVPNLYAAHFDEEIWGDPEKFRPERFLDENGNSAKRENLLHFSTGKRVCIGESLARDELFLFATSLFQTFTVSAAAGKKQPSVDPILGIVLRPNHFEMVLTERCG